MKKILLGIMLFVGFVTFNQGGMAEEFNSTIQEKVEYFELSARSHKINQIEYFQSEIHGMHLTLNPETEYNQRLINLYGMIEAPTTLQELTVMARPKRHKSYKVHFVHLSHYDNLRTIKIYT